ncbi:uncharacterized protein [Ptychodera flava]|uniref:uncharacterized protein n=1 Tax=Ptychodera flava TaxID=63121 RepID=UPI00396A2827
MASPLPRVMIWYQCRSRSTALELSLASVPTFKIFHDHFFMAGVNTESIEELNFFGQIPGNYSYDGVKDSYEKTYPGKEAVIAKDTAVALKDKYQYIPDGFKHVFLIRDPRETIRSTWEVVKSLEERGFASFDTRDLVSKLASLQPTWNLYNHLVKEKKDKPIIIDSQDLVRNPRDILNKLCGMTGLTFRESMLKWKPGNIDHWPDLVKIVNIYESSIYGAAVESEKFDEALSKPHYAEIDSPLQLIIETDSTIFRKMIEDKLQ